MAAACADSEAAAADAKWTALWTYLRVVNDTPAQVTQAHVDAAKAAGWSERALCDAVTVCAIFNFFNRWIDGTGVPDVPPGFYEAVLATRGDMGYRMRPVRGPKEGCGPS